MRQARQAIIFRLKVGTGPIPWVSQSQSVFALRPTVSGPPLKKWHFLALSGTNSGGGPNECHGHRTQSCLCDTLALRATPALRARSASECMEERPLRPRCLCNAPALRPTPALRARSASECMEERPRQPRWRFNALAGASSKYGQSPTNARIHGRTRKKLKTDRLRRTARAPRRGGQKHRHSVTSLQRLDLRVTILFAGARTSNATDYPVNVYV
jgi:hypothetical protein